MPCEQAFAWCAERGIGRIEMGVGGWAQATGHLDLSGLLREASARHRLAEHAGRNLGVNFDPSHFWWQGIDPLCVIEEVGDRIGFAHGKDTLIHADRVRRDGVIDFRHPVDPATASWHFAAVGAGHDLAVWAELLGALRAAGYDGDLSIEHEDPRMGPEEGIEISLAGLRAALAHPEVAVG